MTATSRRICPYARPKPSEEPDGQADCCGPVGYISEHMAISTVPRHDVWVSSFRLLRGTERHDAEQSAMIAVELAQAAAQHWQASSRLFMNNKWQRRKTLSSSSSKQNFRLSKQKSSKRHKPRWMHRWTCRRPKCGSLWERRLAQREIAAKIQADLLKSRN